MTFEDPLHQEQSDLLWVAVFEEEEGELVDDLTEVVAVLEDLIEEGAEV